MKWYSRNADERLEWILNLERSLPVNQWTIDGVHIWPLIRTRLGFLVFLTESKDKGKDNSLRERKPGKLKWLWTNVSSLISFAFRRFDETPVIGSDFAPHRTRFEGKLIDKYFDPIFDQFEPRFSGLIVEYQRTPGLVKDDYYKPERILKFYEFRDLLQAIGIYKSKFTKARFDLESYEQLLTALRAEGFDDTSFLPKQIRKSISAYRSFSWFWRTLFRKTKARVAIGLCYYSDPLFAMVLAAREVGVVSVDLQHGGQGRNHLGYAQFLKLPADRTYNLLPNYFWCWDDSSASPIREWITELHANHKVLQKGLPWHEFLRSRKWPQLDRFQNIIVITLQSYDATFPGPFLDDYLAETIRLTSNEFNWFVRLHPRQQHLRNGLKAELKLLGVSNEIDVDASQDLPFPAILSRASVHITKSSGSGVEAAMFGVHNIILDEHGAARYREDILVGTATLYLEKDPLKLAQVIRDSIGKRRKPLLAPANWDFILDLKE